jgi:hypothetical protein
MPRRPTWLEWPVAEVIREVEVARVIAVAATIPVVEALVALLRH